MSAKRRIPSCPMCKNRDVHVEIRNWTYAYGSPVTIPETKFRCCPHCKNHQGEAYPFEVVRDGSGNDNKPGTEIPA